jgi:hypothetical protein
MYCKTKSNVTKELFVKLFFFYTYYVGIAVIARGPADITQATQKSLDCFIN